MNKSTILTFALLALSTMVVAQTTPIDFEDGGNGADWTWSVFENGTNPALEIIDNPDATGNTSAKVAKMTVVPEGQTFAGTISTNITPFKFDATNSIVKIWVWKSVISDVGLKFETASAASNGEIKVANTKVNEWEELTFDFSGQAVLADDLAGIVVFPDFNARTDTNVVYFDNITFGAQPAATANLFFSEYIEGSSNNKALEIYNASSDMVTLDEYQIAQSANGGGWAFYHTFPAGATLGAGETYVIITDQTDASLFDAANADEVLGFPSVVHHNGDDARAILHISGADTTILDIIGDPDNDPGSGWDVAGVTEGTKEHTLVRKQSVTSGNTTILGSFGTDEATSEWFVLAQNDFSNLGVFEDPAVGVVTPTPPYEVGDNIVANGSFDAFALGAVSNSLNWSFNTTPNGANAVATIVDAAHDGDSRALQIEVGTFNGADDWNVEAVNEPINVVAGERYRADVWLKSSADSSIARTYIGLPASGGWARFEQEDFVLSTEWQKYTIYRTATPDDETNTMRFGMALNLAENENDTVWIDHLTITKVNAPVEVTFNVNTATMPDTLMPSHVIQLRGGTVGPDASGTGLGSTVTWDSGSIVANNIGGDYWTISFLMSPGDTLNYKWWAGADVDNGLANGGETGWESGGNNQFILAGDATGSVTSDLQWFETRMKPFESKTDTVGIWFRVNVGAQIQLGDFDPAQHGVAVRGTPAPLGWDDSAPTLNSEGQVGQNHFYSGVVYFDAAELAASAPDSRPAGTVKYKFFLNNGTGDSGYENGADKYVTLGAMADTTFHWGYFSGEKPSDTPVFDTNLNFEVNVGILEGIGFFNSAIDTVFVRGDFNGWGEDNQMTFNDISGNYDATNIPLRATEGKEVPYKYYLKWDSRRDSSESDFFLEGIDATGSGWEEPGSTAGGNRILVIEDAASQPVRSESYNDVPPQALITPSITEGGGQLVATFSIDMKPAADRTDGTTAFDAVGDSVFLIVDTPFFALTNGIIAGDGDFATRTAEQRDKVMFTDPDNDMVYTLELTLSTITLNNIGFRIAYGEPTAETGELIINGEGFDAGRRYYQFIQPIVSPDGDDADDLPDVSWPATYAFPMLTWSPRDLAFETPPDYSTITSSSELEGDNANRFVLSQNYPNPFNPSTNISFSMPNAANVTLTVYNVLGQEVSTLINNKALNSGTHTVAFDASALSSGMYIYRIEAGSFVSTKRMMLIK